MGSDSGRHDPRSLMETRSAAHRLELHRDVRSRQTNLRWATVWSIASALDIGMGELGETRESNL